MSTIENTKTITLSEQAMSTMQAIAHHVQALAGAYGEGSPEHSKAAHSALMALTGLMTSGFGPAADVSRDGDLSLYVRENGFGYGIVFHTRHRQCTTCKAQLGASGEVRWAPRDEARCADGTHTPDYPLGQPSPGSWSTHS